MTSPFMRPRLALLALVPEQAGAAALMARRLGLPLLSPGSDPASCDDADALLLLGATGLSLQRTGPKAPGPVSVDFGSGAMRHRRNAGHNELLGRAVGVGKKSPLRVLDATAGLGSDAFVLADLGCEVVLCEREPVIFELLHAGLCAARAVGDAWLDGVLDRMQLVAGDARDLVDGGAPGPDVICLDPMFPQRGKSAAVKKEMTLLQLLLDGNAAQSDAEDLLQWALHRDVARVVVKRPPRAPRLAGREPSHEISGKAVRYDVYVRRKLG